MKTPFVWIVEMRRKKAKAIWRPYIGGYLYKVAAEQLLTELAKDWSEHYELRVTKYRAAAEIAGGALYDRLPIPANDIIDPTPAWLRWLISQFSRGRL